MADCPHDDDPATCPPCRRAAGKDRPPARSRIVSHGVAFTAEYPGHCEACNLPIHVGQAIRVRLFADDESTYVHDTCGATDA